VENSSYPVLLNVYTKQKHGTYQTQIVQFTLRLTIAMTSFFLLYMLNDFPMILQDYLEPKIEHEKQYES
jgi:hypothetical protein